jgi:hypothetical protein
MKRVASYVLAAVLALVLVPLAGVEPAGAVPDAPTLSAPADGATVTSNPVLAWNGVTGATSYRVQVSASSAFTPLLVNITTPNTKYGHTADLPLGVLYWRVAAIDGSGQGGFSTDRTFTKEQLSGPVLLSPADGADLEYPADPPVFTWQPFAGADRYEIQIDTEPSFGAPVTTVSTSNPAYTLTTPPTIGQPYYWRVRALSGASIASQYSDERTYSFDWPEVPVLQAPPDDNSPSSAIEEVVFQWSPSLGANTYDLQVSASDQFTTLVVNATGIKSTRYSPPTTVDNGAYFWRVRARNVSNAVGDWSEVSTFYRAWPAPDSPPNHRVTLLTPSNGDLSVGLPEFSWTPVRLASSYELQLGDDPLFSPGTFVTCSTQHTSFIPLSACDPDPGDTHYWRVRPIDGPEPVTGLWSSTFSFVYNPGIPTLLSPPDGASGLVAPFELTWTSVHNDNGPDTSNYKVSIFDGDSNLAETAETFDNAYVPQSLDPAEGPFTWYVQLITESGEGVIPGAGSHRDFSMVAPSSFSPEPDPVVPDAGSGVQVPFLEWEPVDNATGYQLWIATAPSSIYTLLSTPAITVSGYTHTRSLPPGDYTFFIRASLEGGGTVDGDIGAFTVEPLSASVLTDPDHCPPNTSCPVESETPTLEWDWDPDASHYLIYIAADPNFTNIVSGFNGVRVHYPRYRPTVHLPDAQAGQATYWYARPCYGSTQVCGVEPGAFAGANPPIRAFSKRANPVALTSPANQMPGDPALPAHANQIVFDWEDFLATNLAAPGDLAANLEARNYRVQLSTTADMQSIFHTSSLLDQTTYTTFNETLPDGPIYWRVQPYDGSGNALTFSETRLVNKLSPVVTLSTPAAGANVATVPVFSWVSQPYAVRYTIEVYRNVGQPLSSANRVLTTTTSMNGWIPTTALPAGTYGWRVQRRDADNLAGPWTASDNTQLRLFTVAGNAASLLTPVNGHNFTDNNQSFTWTAAPSAAQYRFQADDNADFSSPFESATTVMTSWHSTKVYPNGSYFWRVQTIDGEGNVTATSAVRSFTHGPPPPTATYYHALTPTRILDSRPGPSNVGPYDTKWGPNVTRDVEVAGFGGVPADAESVALNVTVTGTTAGSFLKIYPKGTPEPNASAINWAAGKTIANAFTVKVGTNELVRVENAAGSTHVIFDVVGYYDDDAGTGGGLTPLTPNRLIDSRPGPGNVGPYSTKWGAGVTRDVVVAGGSTGVPSTADAVALNVTATGPTAGSFLTIWPEGESQPTASSLNFAAGQTIPNAVTAAVGDDGEVQIFNSSGSVDVIVDVVGYFEQGSGAAYRALPSPVRIQDSRSSMQVGPYSTKWGANTTRDVTVTGAPANVPTSAVAALTNTTVVDTTGTSFLTVWPDGVAKPTASNLNWTSGVVIANAVTSKLGGPAAENLGKISVYNQSGSTHVLIDVAGYYG